METHREFVLRGVFPSYSIVRFECPFFRWVAELIGAFTSCPVGFSVPFLCRFHSRLYPYRFPFQSPDGDSRDRRQAGSR